MIPAKLLPLIFTYLDWKDLLVVAPSVCGEWRQIAERNNIWRDQIRKNRSTFTNACLLEFESLCQNKSKEELNNSRLHHEVNDTFCKIGLLIRHASSRQYSATPKNQLHLEKTRSEEDVSSCEGSPLNLATAFIHEIKQHIAIFQTIIYLVEKIRPHELENVQDTKSLFRWTVSILQLHPNVLQHSGSVQEFLDCCQQNGAGFIRSIFVNMMRILCKYQERNSLWESEVKKLSTNTAELNTQLEEYKRSMQGILYRYSYISRTHEVKFTLDKMFKKGVIVSTLLTNERRKIITFVLAHTTHGSYHLTVYIDGKLFDVIILEIADLLAKVNENIMAAWYDNFFLNTVCTLRLIERYMLN